jgi:hypothetical protein
LNLLFFLVGLGLPPVKQIKFVEAIKKLKQQDEWEIDYKELQIGRLLGSGM